MYDVPSLPRPKTIVLVLAYAAFISLGLPDGLTGVAWPSIRREFGLSIDALGALITTGTLAYLFSSFTSGRLVHWLGIGWLLSLSCLATAISVIGYGVTPAWAVMVALGLLAGLGAGAIDAGLNTYAAASFSPRIMNWLHAAFGLGAALGPIIMSTVISLGYSWRIGYALVGVAQVLLALSFASTRARWDAAAPADLHEPDQPVAAASLLRTLRLPATWLSMLLFFLYAGVEFCVGQWLYSLLTESRGLAPASAGAWVAAYWISLTLGRLGAGVVVARTGTMRLLSICLGSAVLGIALLWLNWAPWLALGGVMILGAALAPMFPSFVSMTPARMGSQHSANTIGFQIAAATFGGALFVSSFGALARAFGLELLGPFVLIIAVAMAATFLLLNRVSPPRRDSVARQV